MSCIPLMNISEHGDNFFLYFLTRITCLVGVDPFSGDFEHENPLLVVNTTIEGGQMLLNPTFGSYVLGAYFFVQNKSQLTDLASFEYNDENYTSFLTKMTDPGPLRGGKDPRLPDTGPQWCKTVKMPSPSSQPKGEG